MRSLAITTAAPAVLLALLAGEPDAAAANSAEAIAASCISSAEKGQVLRDEGKLGEARGQFAACGADACPAVVRRECVAWLADVDDRMPSVIISVKSAVGGDVVGASVILDGKTLTPATLGRAITVDPGTHTLRFEHARYFPLDKRVVVREREKGRVLEVALEPTSRPTESNGVPWPTWVLGGVAVAGGIGFGALWYSGMNDVSTLRKECAPYCSQQRIDDVRPTLVAARISLGVGIAAAVGAIAAYLFRPGHTVSAQTAMK